MSSTFSEDQLTAIFPGWGASRVIALQNLPVTKDVSIVGDTMPKKGLVTNDSEANPKFNFDDSKNPHAHAKLGTLYSLSISGLDLTGSCLYTAGVVTVNAGKLAPLALFAVTLMLYFFRRVYSEVVTAIPVNGGTYNLMLQVSNKKVAGFVAILSILSYMATAIISAFGAVVYLSLLWPDCEVRLITVLIMVLFCVLTSFGVSDSANVALAMFTLHMLTLTLLICWGLAYGVQDNFATFHRNLQTPYPTIISSSGTELARNSGVASIFFGYSSALLGITGYETASNFCESMKSSKVFVSTVNWMWIIVGIYNPLLSLVSMIVLPMDRIYLHPSDMLAVMAKEVGGQGFYIFLNVDAVIILCGGVLTSLVGVLGLLKRLASDHILPEVLATTNTRGAPHIAIIFFTLLSISLFLAIFDPSNPTAINDFGGVFAIAFLTVLISFISAAVLLKLYRNLLARRVVAKWWQVILSLVTVIAGFIGNIVLTPKVFYLFLAYLSGFVVVIAVMFGRVELLSCIAWILRRIRISETKKEVLRGQEERILLAMDEQDAYDEDAELSVTDLTKVLHINHPHTPQKQVPSYTSVSASDKVHTHEQQHTTSMLSALSPSKLLNLLVVRRPSFTSLPPTASTAGISEVIRTHRSESNSELLLALTKEEHRWTSRWLRYCLLRIEDIVAQPFAYLCKSPDPIALHAALEYITNNEVSNHIYVIHFVDDHPLVHAHNQLLASYPDDCDIHGLANSLDIEMTAYRTDTTQAQQHRELQGAQWLLATLTTPAKSSQQEEKTQLEGKPFTIQHVLHALPKRATQLIRLVNIVDTLYTYKKVSCIVVRGMYFCPRAVASISEYLKIGSNNMIMGVPDTTFKFPIAELHGVRLAVPHVNASLRSKTYRHLVTVMKDNLSELSLMQDDRTFSHITEYEDNNSKKNEDKDINVINGDITSGTLFTDGMDESNHDIGSENLEGKVLFPTEV